MWMTLELDAVHVKGFAFLPVRSTEQSINGWQGWRAFSVEEHLEANFAELDIRGLRQGINLLSHGQKVVEADKFFAWPFVVSTLHLQIVEAIGFQCRRNDGQHRSVHTDLLHADVI